MDFFMELDDGTEVRVEGNRTPAGFEIVHVTNAGGGKVILSESEELRAVEEAMQEVEYVDD